MRCAFTGIAFTEAELARWSYPDTLKMDLEELRKLTAKRVVRKLSHVLPNAEFNSLLSRNGLADWAYVDNFEEDAEAYYDRLACGD